MALYVSPEGKTYDVNPRFGHALEALGWGTEDKPGPQATADVGTADADDDRTKWKKADWLLHADTLGLDVDEKDTLDTIKAAVADVEK